MATVQSGDTIRIHYTGKLEDGTVFDASPEDRPLEFTVGEDEVIPGLEEGVIGMSEGETKTIVVPPEGAYGPRSSDKLFELDRRRVPGGFSLELGQQMQMFRADGMPIMVSVVSVSEKGYMMDCNHPLAGKTLIFETIVIEIL